MVLQPREADWQRASAIVNDANAGIYDDLGEQSVWRKLYPTVLELPAGYATMRTADLPAAEWRKVHILHDAHIIHDVSRAGWHGAEMGPRVEAVDREASRVLREQFGDRLFGLEPPAGKKRRDGAKGGGRGGRKARRDRRSS